MKKYQFIQHFPTKFRPLTQNIMVLVFKSTILVQFTMLAPTCCYKIFDYLNMDTHKYYNVITFFASYIVYQWIHLLMYYPIPLLQ